ncbi:hypothetical protein [Paraburkholderia caribensis]|uniref:hypothetical protein n=1 Tax=Paraburkholderia caribensis TaxID=75105 RepID=UPI00071ED5BC|nr:hypothetical protein [Paraburkholderia caribensis]ALP62820.1 hypothetical protein AN416_09575 [Paraburkholderia caribensis]AUT51949.1 hypothetical protein C2L66_08825 [Paraburkholderia caribensis]
MTTLRETFVEALLAQLEADPDVQQLNVQIGRSVVDALDAQHSLALIVHLGGEAPPDRSAVGFATRQTELLFTVITRDTAPDKAADSVLELAHPIVMSFDAPSLIDASEGQTDPPIFANVDGESCLRTVHYVYIYRTRWNSLTE